jgi:hypothetical protein
VILLAHSRNFGSARLVCSVALLFLTTAAYAANPIQTENAKPGTTAWQLTNTATNGEIEGYGSLTSVNRGGQISFFVNTGEPTYKIEIFRMGWYGGAGGRLVMSVPSLPGIKQSIPTPDSTTGLVECNWIVSYILTIPNNPSDPTDWASGFYLAKLTAGTSGKQSYIIFVVRDDARNSDHLFQSSVTTYQAYNSWGGKSLYNYNSSGSLAAQKVSFNRPYIYGVAAGDYDSTGQFLQWEYNMVRFLEREGYDVSYCTNVDTHANTTLLRSHKGFLSVGHDEYWSWEMRTNVEAARDQGVSLGFFSANTCYWQIRFEMSPATLAPDRTIVCYKYSVSPKDPYSTDDDPSNDHRITATWRNLNYPEDALLGVMSEYGPVDADIIIEDASHWVCAGTGLRNGDDLPGLAGYEVDRMFSNAPAGTARIAHSPYLAGNVTQYSDMTAYTAVTGSTVFATGSIQWSWGLDDYGGHGRVHPAAQQMTRNILARFTSAQSSPTPTPLPIPTPTATPTQGFALTASPSLTFPDQNLTVTWTAPSGRPTTDWIGLYKVGDPEPSFAAWKYTGGAPSGSTTFIAPSHAGQYEFRYFTNNSYNKVATSNAAIVSGGVGHSLTASPSTPSPGQSLTVTWTAPSERPTTDWIGLYKVGDPDTVYISWQYGGGGQYGSTTYFSAPSQAGHYEFRYFIENSYTRMAASNRIIVGGLTSLAGSYYYTHPRRLADFSLGPFPANRLKLIASVLH